MNKEVNFLRIIFIAAFFVSSKLFIYSSALKFNETCTVNRECDKGLRCDTCDPNTDDETKKICTRIQPLNPISKVKGLPFNRYSWLTTHNSFAILGQITESGLVASQNQEDSITSQLNNGVRGLMLDMYDFKNDIWLCHSFGGKCYDFTAFQPAINALNEIRVFLESNPDEIITIFVEDYVMSPGGLTKVFNAAGLKKYWFPVDRLPKNGEDWPIVDDMIKMNQRLLVFTSKEAKEASEGIAFQFKYVVESQYGDNGKIAGVCANRAESSPMDTKSRSLILQNYFPDNPDQMVACGDNSAPLISMMNTCFNASGKRWPNFIAVDFYMKSNGGGAPEAIDIANGHMTCGCDNIAYCKQNATFGTCDVPQSSVGLSDNKPIQLWWLLGTSLMIILPFSWL